MAPPGVDCAIANIAVLLAGKIPVHLDETADSDTFRTVVEQCQIGTMLTTQEFLEQNQDQSGMRWVVNLQTLWQPESPKGQRFVRMIARVLPTRLLQWAYTKRDQHHTPSLATIFFTTQGVDSPQGVMLTHHNILSNLESLDQVFLHRLGLSAWHLAVASRLWLDLDPVVPRHRRLRCGVLCQPDGG